MSSVPVAHVRAKRKARARFSKVAGARDTIQGFGHDMDVVDLLGPESIRTVRSHAKFVVITNDEWNVLITSSMNLNLNPRIEHFDMTDDVERCAMFLAFVDGLFEELPAGGDANASGNQRQTTPVLAGLDAVQPDYGIAMGRGVKVGVFAE